MAEDRLARAVLELSTSSKEFFSALDEAQKKGLAVKGALEETGKGAQKAGGMFTVELGAPAMKAMGWVKDAIVGVTNQIVEMGTHGADVADVSESFNKLTQRTGETSAAMLGELRTGTKNTIDDFELMKMSNGALASGLVKTSADMGALARGAMALADRTGGNAKDAFESLTSAMATGRTSQLKQMGLFVDTDAAVASYAKSLGKSVSALSDQEKAQATAAATLEALKTQFKDPAPADFGDMVAQIKTQFTNLYNETSLAISQSPVLQAGMKAAGEALAGAFGSDQSARIKLITQVVGELAIWVVKAAQWGVDGAKYMAMAWDGLKVIFNAWATVMTTVLSAVTSGIAWLLESASKIPGIGPQFAGVASGVREASNAITAMRDSFAQQAVAAYDSASSTGAAYDKVSSSIGVMLGEMIKAKNAQIEEATASTAGAAADTLATTTKEANAARVVAARQREAAAAASAQDQIRAKTLAIQQEMELAQLTGDERRLMEIEFARQREIAGLPVLREQYATEYQTLVDLINQKYAEMKAAAGTHALTVEQLAARAGYKTRDEMQKTATAELTLYNDMVKSGQYTADQLREQWERAEKAKQDATGATNKFQMSSGQALLSGASQILGQLGQKNKAAAIAGAIINTYQAVAKALASAPWPANLALAAGAAVSGWQTVNQIRNQKEGGYKQGTPNLDFAGFGKMSFKALHDQEAIIPRGKGHLLAGEIASAMPDGSSPLLAAILDELRGQPQAIRRAFRDALATS